ncbi:MAG: hypothetical protein ABIM40_01895 [Pseudomonadota bacterium]
MCPPSKKSPSDHTTRPPQTGTDTTKTPEKGNPHRIKRRCYICDLPEVVICDEKKQKISEIFGKRLTDEQFSRIGTTIAFFTSNNQKDNEKTVSTIQRDFRFIHSAMQHFSLNQEDSFDANIQRAIAKKCRGHKPKNENERLMVLAEYLENIPINYRQFISQYDRVLDCIYRKIYHGNKFPNELAGDVAMGIQNMEELKGKQQSPIGESAFVSSIRTIFQDISGEDARVKKNIWENRKGGKKQEYSGAFLEFAQMCYEIAGSRLSSPEALRLRLKRLR